MDVLEKINHKKSDYVTVLRKHMISFMDINNPKSHNKKIRSMSKKPKNFIGIMPIFNLSYDKLPEIPPDFINNFNVSIQILFSMRHFIMDVIGTIFIDENIICDDDKKYIVCQFYKYIYNLIISILVNDEDYIRYYISVLILVYQFHTHNENILLDILEIISYINPVFNYCIEKPKCKLCYGITKQFILDTTSDIKATTSDIKANLDNISCSVCTLNESKTDVGKYILIKYVRHLPISFIYNGFMYNKIAIIILSSNYSVLCRRNHSKIVKVYINAINTEIVPDSISSIKGSTHIMYERNLVYPKPFGIHNDQLTCSVNAALQVLLTCTQIHKDLIDAYPDGRKVRTITVPEYNKIIEDNDVINRVKDLDVNEFNLVAEFIRIATTEYNIKTLNSITRTIFANTDVGDKLINIISSDCIKNYFSILDTKTGHGPSIITNIELPELIINNNIIENDTLSSFICEKFSEFNTYVLITRLFPEKDPITNEYYFGLKNEDIINIKKIVMPLTLFLDSRLYALICIQVHSGGFHFYTYARRTYEYMTQWYMLNDDHNVYVCDIYKVLINLAKGNKNIYYIYERR